MSLIDTVGIINVDIEQICDWFLKNYIGTFFALIAEQNEDQIQEITSHLKGLWKELNDKLNSNGANSGLFLKSGNISYFEIIAWPFFERAIVLEKLAFTPVLSKWMNEFERIKSWYSNVKELYVIKKNKQNNEFFLREYGELAGKKAEDIVSNLTPKSLVAQLPQETYFDEDTITNSYILAPLPPSKNKKQIKTRSMNPSVKPSINPSIHSSNNVKSIQESTKKNTMNSNIAPKTESRDKEEIKHNANIAVINSKKVNPVQKTDEMKEDTSNIAIAKDELKEDTHIIKAGKDDADANIEKDTPKRESVFVTYFKINPELDGY